MHHQSTYRRTFRNWPAGSASAPWLGLCAGLAWWASIGCGFGCDELRAQTTTPRSSSLIPAAVSTHNGSAELESLLGGLPSPASGVPTSGHFLPSQRLANNGNTNTNTNPGSINPGSITTGSINTGSSNTGTNSNPDTDSYRLLPPSPASLPPNHSPVGTAASLSVGSPPYAGLPVAHPVAHPLETTVPAGETKRRDPLQEQLPGPSLLAEERQGRRAGDSSGLGVGGQSLLQTGVALAFVLALVFGCAWLLRKAGPKSLQPLPLEAVQLLGNAPHYGKQHLRLIRMGQRVLLLAVSETSTQTLTEVTDPTEVSQLLELCQSSHPQSHAKTFEALLRESGRERTSGFLGSQQDQVPTTLRRTRSADTASSVAREPDDSRVAARPASHHFFEA